MTRSIDDVTSGVVCCREELVSLIKKGYKRTQYYRQDGTRETILTDVAKSTFNDFEKKSYDERYSKIVIKLKAYKELENFQDVESAYNWAVKEFFALKGKNGSMIHELLAIVERYKVLTVFFRFIPNYKDSSNYAIKCEECVYINSKKGIKTGEKMIREEEKRIDKIRREPFTIGTLLQVSVMGIYYYALFSGFFSNNTHYALQLFFILVYTFAINLLQETIIKKTHKNRFVLGFCIAAFTGICHMIGGVTDIRLLVMLTLPGLMLTLRRR